MDLPVIHPAHTPAKSVVRGEEITWVSDAMEWYVLLMLGVGALAAGVIVAEYGHDIVAGMIGVGSLFLLWVLIPIERLLLTSEGVYYLRRDHTFGPEMAKVSMPIGEVARVQHSVEYHPSSGANAGYELDVLLVADRTGSAIRFAGRGLRQSRIRSLGQALEARGIRFEQKGT